MQIDISIKTRNTLTEAEKAIRRVPEVYRKDLCENLICKFSHPDTYVLSHTCCSLHDSFHEIYTIYSKLCEANKQQFIVEFPKMCKQFGITL